MDTHRQLTAIILAGGRNSRIGVNKAFLKINAMTFLEAIIFQLEALADEIIISANSGLYSNLPHKVVVDNLTGQGPLMGIYSCLLNMKNEIAFVTACDIPKLNLPFILKMFSYSKKHDVVIPILPDGKIEPLFGFYKKTAIPAIKEVLDRGDRKIRLIYDKLHVKYVPTGDFSWYFNVNTKEDYKKFINNGGVFFKFQQ